MNHLTRTIITLTVAAPLFGFASCPAHSSSIQTVTRHSIATTATPSEHIKPDKHFTPLPVYDCSSCGSIADAPPGYDKDDFSHQTADTLLSVNAITGNPCIKPTHHAPPIQSTISKLTQPTAFVVSIDIPMYNKRLSKYANKNASITITGSEDPLKTYTFTSGFFPNNPDGQRFLWPNPQDEQFDHHPFTIHDYENFDYNLMDNNGGMPKKWGGKCTITIR